jgi:hypothetical protein
MDENKELSQLLEVYLTKMLQDLGNHDTFDGTEVRGYITHQQQDVWIVPTHREHVKSLENRYLI